MEDPESIGKRMAEVRKRIGLNQTVMGDLLGVVKQAVSSWEKGRNDPPAKAILFLADRGKVSTDEILRGRASEPVNSSEQQLLRYFRGMREESRTLLLGTAKAFADKGERTTQEAARQAAAEG